MFFFKKKKKLSCFLNIEQTSSDGEEEADIFTDIYILILRSLFCVYHPGLGFKDTKVNGKICTPFAHLEFSKYLSRYIKQYLFDLNLLWWS